MLLWIIQKRFFYWTEVLCLWNHSSFDIKNLWIKCYWNKYLNYSTSKPDNTIQYNTINTIFIVRPKSAAKINQDKRQVLTFYGQTFLKSLITKGLGLAAAFPRSIFLYDQCGWKQEWLKWKSNSWEWMSLDQWFEGRTYPECCKVSGVKVKISPCVLGLSPVQQSVILSI
jgi:hypothetical protein